MLAAGGGSVTWWRPGSHYWRIRTRKMKREEEKENVKAWVVRQVEVASIVTVNPPTKDKGSSILGESH